MVELAYGLYLAISIGDDDLGGPHPVEQRRRSSSSSASATTRCWQSRTNHLLVVGFYLINIGFITLTLQHGERAADLAARRSVFLSGKVGLAVMVLGGDAFLQHARDRPLRPQSVRIGWSRARLRGVA